MTANTKLTDTQRQLLEHAAQNTGGKIDWFPDKLKGGARNMVLDALFKRALITRDGDGWCLAAEGYDALGVPRPVCGAVHPAEPAQRRTRANSKQAQVVALLQRPEGATIKQICDATGWLSKTVRGAFAGAFKKKLGLVITSSKEAGGERIYRAEQVQHQ